MKQYAVKDRDDSIHDRGSKRDALRSRKAYGGMVVRLKGGAAKTGTAIGAGLIFVAWVVVDIILGISYGVYRLATRSR